jgi:hypothetical protein
MSYFYHRDDGRPPPRVIGGSPELVRLLERCEEARAEADRAIQALRTRLKASPFLQKLWKEFQEAGGGTSRGLRHWLDGDRIPTPAGTRRRHLRLVIDHRAGSRRKPFGGDHTA